MFNFFYNENAKEMKINFVIYKNKSNKHIKMEKNVLFWNIYLQKIKKKKRAMKGVVHS